MPQGLLIALIVVGVIVGLWILLLIFNLIFVGSYLSIFKKHEKAMVVILYTKLENMKKLFAIIRQSGIEIDRKLTEVLDNISENDFQDPSSPQGINSNNALSYLNDEINYIISEHPELNDNPEFVQTKANVVDSGKFYRSNLTMYNADVLGYNYWIRFLPCRFVFKLFKVKEKEIIS